MSTTPAQRTRVLAFYDGLSRWMRPAVERVADDADATLSRARERFDDLIDELPYVDRPDHTMAPPLFACAAALAVFEVVRERGVDAHAWGREFLTLPPAVGEPTEASRQRERREAAASQADAARGEFVWQIVDADESGDRGMNIISCAICHLFSGRDAMELVPYMCAYDDVVSRAGNRGLRRIGTIALGAARCDFRFRPAGEPRPLAPHYPDRIRVSQD